MPATSDPAPGAPDVAPDVAIVLPPREQFAPDASGAVALLVHRLTRAPSRYRRLVIGTPCPAPFTDVPFRPVRPRLGLRHRGRRYAAALAPQVAHVPMLEVHNRADVALELARLCPGAHVTLFVHNDPQSMRGLRSPADRIAATNTLRGIVCVSHYLADRITQDAPGAQACVVPNCIDLSCMPPPAAAREPLILFAGRLVADKGADSFVAACALALPHLPGWRAEMIGADRFHAASPVTPFIAALRPAAARAGVALSGYRPYPQVLATMARAAIVVVPSRWNEPFGLTALDAMASGAALICSSRGGLPEVVGDAALPCDPEDPPSIAACIRSLAANPSACAARGAAGRARAASFDLPIAAAALDHYRDQAQSARDDPRTPYRSQTMTGARP